MTIEQSLSHFNKRLIIVTGHYGSGKTEFSVSLALQLAQHQGRPFQRLALVDLDIVNPYFRSRERMDLLKQSGVSVYGSIYKTDIAAELPELAADIRAPLEDEDCQVIIDAGGNDAGAKILNQFKKYYVPEETCVLAVLNFNRFETRDVDSARDQVTAIEAISGLRVEGVVNNTHLLRETTAETVLYGHKLTEAFCQETGKTLWCDCYPEALVESGALEAITGPLLPLGLFMRPTWLDR